MLVWWQYTVTFVGSLIVALISVWFAQWLSTRREYRKALVNLKSEVSTNINNSALICAWVDKNLKSLKDGKVVVATCPHLYDLAWVSVKGDLVAKDYRFAASLEEVYGMVSVANDLLHTIWELKWGVGGAMTGIQQRRTLVLDATKEIVRDSLMPRLVEAKKVLDTKSQ